MSNKKECFFITPIDSEGSEVRERSNKVMEYIVEEAVSDYGYSVTRADKMDQPGSITNQVIQKTINSELVIADLTDHNPNVFYELAVRHATGEPYIQLINSNESIPFDISDFRTIRYGLKVDKADQAKEEIRGLLQKLEDEEPEFDNPISASAEMQSLRESADPTDQNLAEILNTMYSLDNRMNQLENLITNSESESERKNVELGDFNPPHVQKGMTAKEKQLYSGIREMENNKQSPVSKNDILRMADKLEIDEEKVEEILHTLMKNGEIYQLEENMFRTT